MRWRVRDDYEVKDGEGGGSGVLCVNSCQHKAMQLAKLANQQ